VNIRPPPPFPTRTVSLPRVPRLAGQGPAFAGPLSLHTLPMNSDCTDHREQHFLFLASDARTIRIGDFCQTNPIFQKNTPFYRSNLSNRAGRARESLPADPTDSTGGRGQPKAARRGPSADGSNPTESESIRVNPTNDSLSRAASCHSSPFEKGCHPKHLQALTSHNAVRNIGLALLAISQALFNHKGIRLTSRLTDLSGCSRI